MSDNEIKGITEAESAPMNDETPNVETGQSEVHVPEKFLGKSQADIIKSYQELESELGRLRNEYGLAKKERDEIIARYQQLEQYLTQNKARTEHRHDPYEVFNSKFDEDPKTAILEALRLQEQRLLEAQKEQQRMLRQQELQRFYNEQRANPDFVRREALMQQLALRFSSLLNPEYISSPEALQLLDLASKGADLGYYEQQAVERAKKGGLSARAEKLQAQSESASISESVKDSDSNFESLSLAEMEKRLGRVS